MKIVGISVELTNEEVKMIANALSYYGDKIADTQGYSAGEKYWNLITKFTGDEGVSC